MTKTVEIDGVEYAPVEVFGDIKIVVMDKGFVYIGHVLIDGDDFEITNARCIIRWGTTEHLGQLVNGPLENTKLGDPCTLRIKKDQCHTIEVNQDAWNNNR